MNFTDKLTPEQVEAIKPHYVVTTDDTIAVILASLVEGAVQAQLDELSDDQWGVLDAIGAIDGIGEDNVRGTFDRLAGAISEAMGEQIKAWLRDVAIVPADVVTVYGPAEDDDPAHWTVSGDLRNSDHDRGNYVMQTEVQRRVDLLIGVAGTGESLAGSALSKVTFDSEMSCFFAYCPDQNTAEVVAGIAWDVYQTFTPAYEGEQRFTQPEHAVGYYPEN